MKRCAAFTTFWIMLCISEHTVARESWGVYTHINSLTYSEIMSIDGFINDFSGELEVGQTALTHDLAEVGIQYGAWRIGRVLRYDYDMTFSNDTALLNYQIERRQPIDLSIARDVSLSVEHLRSEGFRVAQSFSLSPAFSIQVGVSWLKSTQFYSGSVHFTTDRGSLSDAIIAEIEALAPEYEARAKAAVTTEEIIALGEEFLEVSSALQSHINTSRLQGTANYYYSEPALREDEVGDFDDIALTGPSGQGFTMDVALTWQLNNHWQVSLDIRDWYSRIVWQDSPATTASADVTQAALQALDTFDDFVEQDIIRRFSGQFFQPINPESPDDPAAAVSNIVANLRIDNSEVNVRNERFVQTLTRQTHLATRYESGSWWALSGHVTDYKTFTFWHLRADLWQWLGFEWHPKVDAFGISLYHPLGKIQLVADSSHLDDAKYLSLAASLVWTF